jgi:catechol 2,3-dioxygenase-like lactoylglutathione lyase family enzyme
MAISATLVHVNLIARDWERLAAFYEIVFGCVRVPPERDLAGPWLDRATGVSGARIRGVHLRFSGNAGGPTLEIFQFAYVMDPEGNVIELQRWEGLVFAPSAQKPIHKTSESHHRSGWE